MAHPFGPNFEERHTKTELKQIQKSISEYFISGWKLVETDNPDCFSFYITSPNGFSFNDRNLRLNICSICEDAEIEGCTGGHLDDTIQEEEEASKLCKLINSLPFPYKSYLPKQ
jgi:hypothetical protein